MGRRGCERDVHLAEQLLRGGGQGDGGGGATLGAGAGSCGLLIRGGARDSGWWQGSGEEGADFREGGGEGAEVGGVGGEVVEAVGYVFQGGEDLM